MKKSQLLRITAELPLIKIRFILLLILSVSGLDSNGQKVYDNFAVGIGVTYFKFEGYNIELIDPRSGSVTSRERDLLKKGINRDSSYSKGEATPLTAFFNWNYPLYKIKKSSAIGINPGITFSGNGNTIGLTVPIFLTFKMGTDAQTREYGKRVGFTSGIGFVSGGYYTEDITYILNKPACIAEISLLSKFLVNKIRFTSAFGSIHSNFAPKDETSGSSFLVKPYFQIGYLMTFIK